MTAALRFPSMSPRGRTYLWWLLVVGATVEVVVAFVTPGLAFDMAWWRQAGRSFQNGFALPYELEQWNYPPGFLPIAALAESVGRLTPLPFHGVVKLPSVAATVALAWLVQGGLGRRGAAEHVRLGAAGLVVLGPMFLLITSYHGQIDALAILPAVLALLVWEAGGTRRAAIVGILLGLAICVKLPTGFALLALLPTARRIREGVVLLGATVAVPLAVTLPFVVAAPAATLRGLTSNHGVPGWGGLSALLQPSLTRFWLSLEDPAEEVSPVIDLLNRRQNLIVLSAALLAGVVLMRRREEPITAAAAIFLVVLVANPNWAYNYVVWALPFLLLTGRVRPVAVLQVVAGVGGLILYAYRGNESLFLPYLVLSIGVWALLLGVAVTYFVLSSAVLTGRPVSRSSTPTLTGGR